MNREKERENKIDLSSGTGPCNLQNGTGIPAKLILTFKELDSMYVWLGMSDWHNWLRCTAVFKSNRTVAIFVSKMAYFKSAWRKVKVLPRL